MKNKALIWICQNCKSAAPAVMLLTMLGICASFVSLAFSVVSKKAIDIATGQAAGLLLHTSFMLAGLIFLQLLLNIVIAFVEVHASSKMEISLKRHTFGILINKNYLSVARIHSGELLNRLTSDVSVIVSGIINILPGSALFLTKIIGGFIILYRLDSVFARMILAFGPLVLLSARVYSGKMKGLHKKCQESDGKTRSFMQEMLQNILVVKSFGHEETVLESSERLQEENYRLRIMRTMVSVLANTGIFISFNVGYYFALAYGAFRLSGGFITYGTVIAMLQLVGQIQTPFKNISGLVPQFYSMLASGERLFELEELEDEGDSESFTSEDIYRDMDGIVFENVSFSYNEDAGISNVNIQIKKGECVVIAGESGAGKSTLIKLLLGLMQPSDGRLYIKTAGGDIAIGRGTRSLFSYVPQGNLILSGTIRDNILFAKKTADDEEIIRCLKIAQIWDFVKGLERGLDTELGEKGIGLSEGQVQRLAIARAILYDAPILLLDEATSALDSQTESELLESIRKMTDKTCILVSHKKAAFDICDKVICI
ncbi:MAG: ABC transporter ATP-binding protein/permease [Clostridia bacterium]|nr:ABC transporter ATP-binding protein/permease [Clostridia bacterium]